MNRMARLKKSSPTKTAPKSVEKAKKAAKKFGGLRVRACSIKNPIWKYGRTLLVADPRRCEPKKSGRRSARLRARYLKSCR